MTQKTLLVTGAAGFIGCEFVRVALAAGYQVIGFDALTYSGSRANLAGVGGAFELIEGDIRDANAVELAFSKARPTYVVHFAAETHVDRSIDDPLLFVNTNVLGSAQLLHHSHLYWKSLDQNERAEFRYVQVSTDEVYGALGTNGAFREDSPLAPSSPYSASKAGADLLVNAWRHTFGLPTLVTRCTNNYGPFQYPEKLIPLVIRRALAEQTIPIYGDGHQRRDWIHVRDHCAGILLAMTRGRIGATYIFAGQEERRNLDLAREICAALDSLRPRAHGRKYAELIQFVEDRPGHDFRYALDDTNTREELGWSCRIPFSEGLRDTVAWYLKAKT